MLDDVVLSANCVYIFEVWNFSIAKHVHFHLITFWRLFPNMLKRQFSPVMDNGELHLKSAPESSTGLSKICTVSRTSIDTHCVRISGANRILGSASMVA